MQRNSPDSEQLDGLAPVSSASVLLREDDFRVVQHLGSLSCGSVLKLRCSMVRLAGEPHDLSVPTLTPSPENSVWILWKCESFSCFNFFFVPLIYKPLWGKPVAYKQDICCFALGPVCLSVYVCVSLYVCVCPVL